MIRRPPRSTRVRSSAASDVYKRQAQARSGEHTAGGPRFTPTTDFDRLAECDAMLICVPTPLGPHREPDLSYVFGTTREIAARLHPGQLVVLESTTYPGTTEEELRPLLEETGLRTGAESRLLQQGSQLLFRRPWVGG